MRYLIANIGFYIFISAVVWDPIWIVSKMGDWEGLERFIVVCLLLLVNALVKQSHVDDKDESTTS